uniref:Uncharacterized protein n=1 Tax=Solanum lycopersicum TaxID=4081 RepID=A0A3Q7I5S6_SOLLC
MMKSSKLFTHFIPLNFPRLDELHHMFYHKNWNIIKEKAIIFYKNVFEDSSIPSNHNYILMCLIRQSINPPTPTSYRPMHRPLHQQLQLVTKIIINSIKPILPS